MNVVAHNLANVENEGFVRQQVVYQTGLVNNIGNSAVAPLQIGLGVTTAQVRQVRDFFLDQTYRREVGREGYYDAQADAVDEIENLFGELDGAAFQSELQDYWVSMQELAKEPDSRVAQSTFIETSIALMDRADSISGQLKKYQLDLNTEIRQKIDRINQIGNDLYKLNRQVAGYEASNVENANDLRDNRNDLLDELAQMVKINYRELESGVITVEIEGVSFVNEDACYPMGATSMSQYLERNKKDVPLDECAEILLATWPHLGDAEVFDWSTVPNAEANSDVGSLKGAIQARGTKVGKYTDIPLEPKTENFIDEFGDFDEDAYKAAMVKYDADTREYNRTIEASILMRTQAQFDQLIHGIVTTVNDCLCPNREVVVAAGTTITRDDGTEYTFEEDTKIKIFDEKNAPIGVDADSTAGTELFQRKTFNRYMDAQDITLADGSVIEGARIFNWEDPNDNYSLYTLGELQINKELIENKSKLPVISNDGTRNYDITMMEKLLTKWQEPFATLSPNTLTYNNIESYYVQFTGGIATKGDECRTLADNQESMVNSVQDKRTGITAVSSDEELTYLIRYQHAYNASARYINVIDEMLEHLIERLG